jgi:hypothetical protein
VSRDNQDHDTVNFTLRLPHQDIRQLRESAERAERSLQAEIRLRIRRSLQSEPTLA